MISTVGFYSAVPVWPAGRRCKMNDFVGFRTVIHRPAEAISCVLRLTASCLYRAWLNGDFVGYGPARAAHGYFRVDEWDLAGLLKTGSNQLAIEVAGYNVNSYYTLDQPSFLLAEVVADNHVIAATSMNPGSFDAVDLVHRVQRVQRYSFQRPFIEVYKLTPSTDDWRCSYGAGVSLTLEDAEPIKLLPRGLRMPVFDLAVPRSVVARGRVEHAGTVSPWRDRSLVDIGPKLKGFAPSDLELCISDELSTLTAAITDATSQPFASLTVPCNGFVTVDFGHNISGFVRTSIQCTEPVCLMLIFDELLTNGDIDWSRLTCCNAVTYHLQPGRYQLETFEAYTLRFLKLLALGGPIRVDSVDMRQFQSRDGAGATLTTSDEDLSAIFNAAVNTLRQNSADLLTDCPSRERAGWLCDSFFSSRAAFDLVGDSNQERAFLENYALGTFAHLPPGMIGMCYPADHYDGVFIPQWAMWWVLHLEEFLQRSNDLSLIEASKSKVEKLFDYYSRFENDYGLLENLESWSFIEWSKANNYLEGVNYPSNMLYAATLAAAARLYGRRDWLLKSDATRKGILRQSYDGEFFVDNAVRNAAGQLMPTRNRSEVCQYFAFYFDVASPSTHSQLWTKLLGEFGPTRKLNDRHPQVVPANMIIGNYLRCDLLSRYGLRQQLREEIVGYFAEMPRRTGTLWEHNNLSASANHGFAAHVVRWILRDLIGLSVARECKQISLERPIAGLAHGRLVLPLVFGRLEASWSIERDVPDASLRLLSSSGDIVDGWTLRTWTG